MPLETSGTLWRDTDPDSTSGDGKMYGTLPTSKVSLFGATPAVQSAVIATIANNASGTQIATAVNALIVAGQVLGNVATS